MSELIHGNALEVLAEMEPESVHCCITSPPYWGLRSYGEGAEMVFGGEEGCEHEWGPERIVKRSHPGEKTTLVGTQTADLSKSAGNQGQFCRLCSAWRGQFGLEPTPELYVEHTLEFLRAIRRVLRDDGTVWWNIGDSYAGSGKGQLGDGTHAAKCGEKQKTNVGATLGGLPTEYNGLKPKDLVLIPFRVALAAQADGWWVRSVIIWSKPNPMPESVRDRPTTSHEYVLLLTKSARYFYDADAIREPIAESTAGDHRLGWYEAGRPERDYPTERPDRGGGLLQPNPSGRNKRTVWEVATQPYPEAHFATFPPALIEPMVLTTPTKCCAECGAGWERMTRKTPNKPRVRIPLGKGSAYYASPQGPQLQTEHGNDLGIQLTTLGFRPTCSCDAGTKPAVILDPFAGTGTVGWVARKHGRDYVLIEMVEKYVELAKKRLEMVPKEVYTESEEMWLQPRLVK